MNVSFTVGKIGFNSIPEAGGPSIKQQEGNDLELCPCVDEPEVLATRGGTTEVSIRIEWVDSSSTGEKFKGFIPRPEPVSSTPKTSTLSYTATCKTVGTFSSLLTEKFVYL